MFPPHQWLDVQKSSMTKERQVLFKLRCLGFRVQVYICKDGLIGFSRVVKTVENLQGQCLKFVVYS